MRLLSIALLLMFSVAPALSSTLAQYTFDDEHKSDEFRSLIGEMRCLVCQNESLAASNAELAVDLREEIYEMMKAGKSKEEIIEFMVARYGDFVLYSPPVKLSTSPLWFGPVILFVIGGLVLYINLRRKSLSREVELSEEEKARLSKILNKKSSDSKVADQ